MSVKGKERASNADSDPEMDFFTIKRPIIARKASPIRILSSSPEGTSESDDAEGDKDGEGKIKKKRRKKKSRGKPAVVPSWMEAIANGKKGKEGGKDMKEGHRDRDRTRSSSKTVQEVIEIGDSADEGRQSKKRRKRIEVELTPPPELPEAEKERLRRIVDQFCPVNVPDDPAEEEDEPSISSRPSIPSKRAGSPSSRPFEPDERLTIALRMVADPARRAAGDSERAIQRYELKRSYIVNRRDPLSRLIGDIADRLQRSPDDLILEHNGTKVFRGLTPFRMGFQANAEVEMLGYEKAVYEKIVKKRELDRKRRIAEATGEDFDEEEEEGEEEVAPVIDKEVAGGDRDGVKAGEEAGKDDNPPEEEPAARAVIIILRGGWGEFPLRVGHEITVQLLVDHYCRKAQRRGEQAKVTMEFDGEKLESDMTVGEIGVEHKDIIDVITTE